MTSRDDSQNNLRAAVQEAVHHYTDLLRAEIREQNPGITERELNRLQPEITEFDPVIELALIGANYRNEAALRRAASSDAAQYLRPKLKSIEVVSDPATIETENQRNSLTSRLVDLLQERATKTE